MNNLYAHTYPISRSDIEVMRADVALGRCELITVVSVIVPVILVVLRAL